jgi:hypothetical protein
VLSRVKQLGTIPLKKKTCTIRFKPFKHMEAQEISVQSKPPKSFKFGYRIDIASDFVTDMVVDNDDSTHATPKHLFIFWTLIFVCATKLSTN